MVFGATGPRARPLHWAPVMTTAPLLGVVALLGSLTGCLVRSGPYPAGGREARGCPATHHWDRDRCVENRRAHGHDRDGDRDHHD